MSRRANKVHWIEAVLPLILLPAYFAVAWPPFRLMLMEAGIAILMLIILVGLGVGVAAGIHRRLKNSSSDPWIFGSQRILRSAHPLRSFNLATLEAMDAKPATVPPGVVDYDPAASRKTVVHPPLAPPTAKPYPRFQRTVYVTPPPVITRPKATPSTAEIIGQLRQIDWFQFEQVVALMYRKQGYQVNRRGGANPDGGIDLIIEKNGVRQGVQCKHWQTSKIKESTVRELVGALHIGGLQRGVFVSLGGCTDPARRLAEAQGIAILEECQVADMLAAVDASYNPEILELLNDERKYCPKCESEMVLRTAKAAPTNQFWGCSKYPRCRYILPLK